MGGSILCNIFSGKLMLFNGNGWKDSKNTEIHNPKVSQETGKFLKLRDVSASLGSAMRQMAPPTCKHIIGGKWPDPWRSEAFNRMWNRGMVEQLFP